MQTPFDIAFRHFEPSEEIRAEIAAQAQRLEKYSPRITSCHVVVNGPQTRHRSGDHFHIQIRVAIPEGKDVVVDRRHDDAGEREHVRVAIREAFAAAARQVEDAAREMRGDVKAHAAESHGRVTRFLAGQDGGFIGTADGREIYFHRNAVLDGGFARLSVGSEVRFVEEDGEKGAQASTVRRIGKHHLG
jgi:cold shock CspA family protein/ribosome-associated translation inhibitor RaiA